MSQELKEKSSDDDPPDEGDTFKNVLFTLFSLIDAEAFHIPINY